MPFRPVPLPPVEHVQQRTWQPPAEHVLEQTWQPPKAPAESPRAVAKDRLGLRSIPPELAREAREYMKIWSVTFEQALKAVLARRALLGKRINLPGEMFMKTKVTVGTIGRYVHKKAMEKLTNGDAVGYWEAFHQTLDEDAELKAMYAGMAPTTVAKGPEIKPSVQSSQAAGSEIDALVRRFMAETNTTDYAWSLRQILRANPELARKYTQI